MSFILTPPELRNGWFTSDLHFYDLQKSLAEGTPLALAVSLCVVGAVCFITTLNALVALYAFFTVSGKLTIVYCYIFAHSFQIFVQCLV